MCVAKGLKTGHGMAEKYCVLSAKTGIGQPEKPWKGTGTHLASYKTHLYRAIRLTS